MSDYIEASFDSLLDQASGTAATYLRAAQREIDDAFGVGYAADHPELVAAFMKTAAADYHTAATAKVLGNALQAVGYSLDSIASAIRDQP